MIAVIGCGNPNRSDDGAGPQVIRALRRLGVGGNDPRVMLLDAGTDGMAVMFGARGCRTLIIIDACRSNSDPGAVFEVPGPELERPHEHSLNLHDFRWDHALYAGRRIYGEEFPEDVLVFLIEAQTVALGIGLSAPVEDAVSTVSSRIAALVRERLDTVLATSP